MNFVLRRSNDCIQAKVRVVKLIPSRFKIRTRKILSIILSRHCAGWHISQFCVSRNMCHVNKDNTTHYHSVKGKSYRDAFEVISLPGVPQVAVSLLCLVASFDRSNWKKMLCEQIQQMHRASPLQAYDSMSQCHRRCHKQFQNLVSHFHMLEFNWISTKVHQTCFLST